MRCYVDTSALIKRYVHEARSDEFDRFCVEEAHDLFLGPLVATEFVSSVERRVRLGEVAPQHAKQVRERFQADVLGGGLHMAAFDLAAFARATELIRTLGVPLATLDALHLASALLLNSQALATADRQLAAASRKAALHVFTFH